MITSKNKQILVAVDGSENSKRAVRVASQLVLENKEAELTILHVMTMPSAAYSADVPALVSELEEDARSEGEKFVAAAVSLAEQNGVEKVKTALTEHFDSPVRGITDYADKNNIDLIVVGTRGLGSFKRLLLGSVASGVVQYAHCSVLVVR